MKKILIVLLFQLGVTTLNAQNFKFGKVSKEELQEKSNPLDASANATILYSSEKIKYEYNADSGFYILKDIHKRIKIYNKEGLGWARHFVRLYDKSRMLEEEISSLKGVTYNLVDGEIKGQKMKKDGVFEEKENDYWKKISFTLPNIKEGSVIEYKYQIKSPFTTRINDAILQELVPIRKIVYEARIPEYYTFKPYQNLKSSLSTQIVYDNAINEIYVTWKDNTPGKVGLKKTQNDRFKYKENIIRVNEDNIPALNEEIYVTNLNNYKSKLSFELVSTKAFNSKITNYATDWESVVTEIYKSENFGLQLTKKNYFEKDIDALLKDLTSKQAKVYAIYNYIKSKVKWNEFIGVNSLKGVKKAYKEGVGSVADINLMLTSMLRYAGIDANPILVSTKSNGVPLYPSRQGFNYVICGIEINNEVLLLDASSKNTTVNIVPEKVLNWQGRIIRAHGSSAWVNLFPNKNSISTTMVSAKLDADLVFKGKVRNQKTDYYAYNYRNEYVGVVNEDMVKNISEDKGEIEITNLNIKNDRKLEKPIMHTYDFIYEDGVEEIGAEIYIDPLLFLTEKENVFNQEQRDFPIDFSYPVTDKIIVNLKIPEGYKIKSYPKSEKVVMTEDLGEYSYIVRVSGNTVQISQILKVNSPIIPASYYEGLRGTYMKMMLKNSEKIVLEKI